MIVQPDFLDHWKTQLLIETLEDPTAPLYVIRLWAHCQNRKTHRFPRVNPAITKAICKASKHAPDVFENAMVECGFIRIEDGDVVAHDWEHVNASLIAAWVNGKKGGRPKEKTHGLTLPKPRANPNETDKSRVDKSRLEKTGEEKIRSDGKGVAEVVSFYNDLSCKFPKCKKISTTRRTQINARLDEYGFDNVVETIRTASTSSFLNGGNDRGWKADLEWITKDANYTKITEGKYGSTGTEIDAETSAWLEKIAAGDFREWVAPITRWVEHKTAAGGWDSQTLKYFRRDMENRYAVRGVEIFGNAINESISKKSASIIWSFN